MAGEPARQSLCAGGPLSTYYSDDRPLLPQLKREEIKVLNKESQQKDGGNTVRINVVEAHVNVPTLYIDKKPAPVSSLSLVRLLIVIVFITVSLGFVAINTDYIQTTWSGARTLLGGSALAAFNQTAELVNVTIDDTIYNYLYASLFDD